MSEYEPELGQMLFGQPSKQHACPDILDAALMRIANEIERITGNMGCAIYPMENRADSFRCPVFSAVSYLWSGDEQPWNFKHYASGIEVSWYKYLGRGMSVNREVTPDDAAMILHDCLEALRAVEKGDMGFEEPGMLPDQVEPKYSFRKKDVHGAA